MEFSTTLVNNEVLKTGFSPNYWLDQNKICITLPSATTIFQPVYFLDN